MEQVKISKKVNVLLQKINQKLHNKKYFGSKELATEYVLNLIDFIYTIPNISHRITKNAMHGKYYSTYKYSFNTTWYVSFDIENDKYIVKNITNNHSPDYPKFIRDIK